METKDGKTKWRQLALVCLNQTFKLAALLVLSATLCSCATGDDARKSPGDNNYPAPNPSAKRYFLLSGNIESAMKIRMAARLVAKNPDCSVNVNWLEGVRIPFYTDIPLQLTWKGTHYSTLVQLDGFDPGHCNWSFRSVVVSGADDLGQILEMADWRHPSPDEKKAYSAPEVWGELVMLTAEPLLKKDQSGVRNLICTPSYDNPYHPRVLRCGMTLVHPGWRLVQPFG